MEWQCRCDRCEGLDDGTTPHDSAEWAGLLSPDDEDAIYARWDREYEEQRAAGTLFAKPAASPLTTTTPPRAQDEELDDVPF